MTDRQKKELEQLKKNAQYEIKNSKTLYTRYNDYINNVEPNTQEVEVDNQISNESLRQNSNFMENAFQKKVYKLFNNDVNDSQTFIQNVNDNDKKQFNVIYPQLLKLYKNSMADPYDILDTFHKLVSNLEQTGSIKTSANNDLILKIENIKDFLIFQYNEKQLSKRDGDDLTNVLNGVLSYEESTDVLKGSDKSRWLSLRKKISNDINILIDIMIQDTDAKSKINDIVSVMQDIKTQILIVSKSKSPDEKNAEKAAKKALNAEKADAFQYINEKSDRLKLDYENDLKITKQDKNLNEVQKTTQKKNLKEKYTENLQNFKNELAEIVINLENKYNISV